MSHAQRLQGLKGPAAPVVPTPKAAAPASNMASKSAPKSSTKKDKRDATLLSGLPYNTPSQKELLNKCDWKDRLLYASRMLLGGNNVNGFLRGTATAQRIKKQRARQVGITKKSQQQSPIPGMDATEADKKDKKTIFVQEEEEKLKKEIMNPRTVKKLKTELEASLHFCSQIHNLLRGVIFDVDPRQSPYLPPNLSIDRGQPIIPGRLSTGMPPHARPMMPATPGLAPDATSMPWAVRPNTAAPSHPKSIPSRSQQPIPSTASPGNPEGSTMRKMRKKKLPPNNEPQPNLPEFDNAGRRLVTKKEHNLRLFELLRFRGLRQGDFVAARTTSRDLWILGRVLKDFPGVDTAPLEFLQLSESRRDSIFREKVHVKDVEEKDGNNSSLVSRSLVLPLPRTYSEAAEWGQVIKKGMRIYSMYPNTTSLYPATVVDSTTYCRDEDDIIVVEFDGEEPDETGLIPKYHIPARFVTLIPREFPSSQPPTAKSNKRKNTSSIQGGTPKQKKTDDFMNFDFDGNFDALDLDFDKPLMGDEEDDGGFPPLM